jgi:hypothetical protein
MSALRRRLTAHLFLCALSSVLDLACAQTPVRFAFLLLSLTALHSTPLTLKDRAFNSSLTLARHSTAGLASLPYRIPRPTLRSRQAGGGCRLRFMTRPLLHWSFAEAVRLILNGALHCTFQILTACALFMFICQISSVPSSWSAAHDAARYRHVDVPFQAAQDWLGAGPNREPASVSDNWYKDVAADIF